MLARQGTYGITVAGDSMSIKLVTVGQVRIAVQSGLGLGARTPCVSQYDTNIGARTYVMADPEHYKMYQLKNREFTFDVDVSQVRLARACARE